MTFNELQEINLTTNDGTYGETADFESSIVGDTEYEFAFAGTRGRVFISFDGTTDHFFIDAARVPVRLVVTDETEVWFRREKAGTDFVGVVVSGGEG